MNAEYGDMTRTRPDARLVKTCGVTASASAITPPSMLGAFGNGLPGGELMTDGFSSPDRHDQSPQHPLSILAPRVQRGGPSVLGDPSGFVDVSVDADGGLIPLQRVGDGLRPRAVVHRLSVLDDGLGRPDRCVELHAGVQPRVQRRTVEVEDRP